MTKKQQEKEVKRATPEVAEQEIKDRSKRIAYTVLDYSVEHLVRKYEEEEHYVPEYQREYTWELPRRVKFIESLLLGLPIPPLFFGSHPDTEKLEIIDGSQRIRTLTDFKNNELVLFDLARLPSLEGMMFKDLLESRRRRLMNVAIRCFVLDSGTDEEARRDLFERINTGSKVANQAEIRRGSLQGPFIDLVKRLAADPTFMQLAPMSQKKDNEREREELVTRFFAYGDGLEEYAEEPSPFLLAYCIRMNARLREQPSLAEGYEQRFHRTMAFVQQSFPYGFRRSETSQSTPRVRFEAIAVGTWLALQARPDLAPDLSVGTRIVTSQKFGEIVRSDAANVMKRLTGRLDVVKHGLLTGEV